MVTFENGFTVSIIAYRNFEIENFVVEIGALKLSTVEVAVIDPMENFFRTANWNPDDDVIEYVDADMLVDIMAYVKALPADYQIALVNEQNAIFERRKAEEANATV
jgi:hypothetical protein